MTYFLQLRSYRYTGYKIRKIHTPHQTDVTPEAARKKDCPANTHQHYTYLAHDYQNLTYYNAFKLVLWETIFIAWVYWNNWTRPDRILNTNLQQKESKFKTNENIPPKINFLKNHFYFLVMLWTGKNLPCIQHLSDPSTEWQTGPVSLRCCWGCCSCKTYAVLLSVDLKINHIQQKSHQGSNCATLECSCYSYT